MNPYSADFSLWATEQAQLLRAQLAESLDWQNLANELEAMSARERRELSSRLKILFLHLLKWQFQPERRGNSWRLSIEEQIEQVIDLLETSPSLRNTLQNLSEEAYRRARRSAAIETGFDICSLPSASPWLLEAVLNPDWIANLLAEQETH